MCNRMVIGFDNELKAFGLGTKWVKPRKARLIVSGGGIEFMRSWAERVNGIPPEQVIGSSIKTKFEMHDGKPALVRLPEINFIDDKAGKPVGIKMHIWTPCHRRAWQF